MNKTSQLCFKDLVLWSKEKFNFLPWRQKRTLYKTLISEIMLQQTTVQTVLRHYDFFLTLFPTIEDLAFASEEDLLRAWKGLGYYRRAKNLRLAALDIVQNYKAKFPVERNELMSIKGIGPYTSSAIIAIGMNKRELPLDANLERVLARFYGIDEIKGLPLQKKLRELFLDNKILKAIETEGAREVSEALMDLGRTYCQSRKTQCELCLLRKKCVAHKGNEIFKYPRQKREEKQEIYFELKLLRIIVRDKENVLARKREKNEWLSNQWEVPTFVLKLDTKHKKNFTQYPVLPLSLKKENLAHEKILSSTIPEFKTNITQYKIINAVCEMSPHDFFKFLNQKNENYDWILPSSGDLTTASIKSISYLMK